MNVFKMDVSQDKKQVSASITHFHIAFAHLMLSAYNFFLFIYTVVYRCKLLLFKF